MLVKFVEKVAFSQQQNYTITKMKKKIIKNFIMTIVKIPKQLLWEPLQRTIEAALKYDCVPLGSNVNKNE